jgi:hypothetical protein
MKGKIRGHTLLETKSGRVTEAVVNQSLKVVKAIIFFSHSGGCVEEE